MKRWTGTTMLAATLFASGVHAQTADHEWHFLEADNGLRFAIDLDSITHFDNGSAEAFVYAVEGKTYNPRNLRRIIFDCAGNYIDWNGQRVVEYAPPKSVIAQLSKIACDGAKDRRNDPVPKRPTTPQAKDYCRGFSTEECAQIKAIVEKGVKPEYCKPGFALESSSLTDMKMRICYVMSGQPQ